MEKNYKPVKWLLSVLLLLLFIIAIMVWLSPYGGDKRFSHEVIIQTIDIHAPAERAFLFLGNSNNASHWSSFINHITVLNVDSFADGNVGSRRRCFQNKNEKGMQWDELITKVEVNKERELIIYNLQHFAMMADNLATEQFYENIGSNNCRLTFTLFFKKDNPSIWDALKLYVAAYKIKPIFKRNLNNIKQIIEHRQNE
ncbi:MAG: SRPBCC family protein [Ginsengibacter sp.]